MPAKIDRNRWPFSAIVSRGLQNWQINVAASLYRGDIDSKLPFLQK